MITKLYNSNRTIKSVADFLAMQSSVSQISILGDYKTPKASDNTMQTVKGFGLSLQDTRPEKESTLQLFMLTSVLQAVFLRRDLSKELFGYDYNDKMQRDKLIDAVMDHMRWEAEDTHE